MKNKPSSSKNKKAAAKASSKANVKVKANVRLVAKLRLFETSKAQTQSYLIEAAEIAQSEQLSREEVIVSIMEARGVERSTAESQFSRHKAIFTDPDALEALRSGDADFKTVASSGSKKQKNPSQKKKQENAEKVITRSTSAIIGKMKEIGMDIASYVNQFKAQAKKAGLK